MRCAILQYALLVNVSTNLPVSFKIFWLTEKAPTKDLHFYSVLIIFVNQNARLPWMKVVQRNVSNFHMEPVFKPPFVMVQGTSRCLQIL